MPSGAPGTVLGLSPVPDATWLVAIDGADPARERAVESLLTVGNGRAAIRGTLAGPAGPPAALVAGFYSSPTGDLPALRLVPCPDWTHISARVKGKVTPPPADAVRRVLDMAQGVLFTWWEVPSPEGETTIEIASVRFASMADRSLFGAATEVRGGTAELDAEFSIEAVASLEWAHARRIAGVLDVRLGGHEGRDVRLALATRRAGRGLERVAALSRSYGPPGESDRADQAFSEVLDGGLAAAAQRHTAAVASRWADAAVEVGSDPDLQRAVHFSTFHLMASGDPECEAVSIGARGLSGDGYRGHVFWDTDIFVAPFFIFTHPQTARALLAYRYHTLGPARVRAERLGCRGALYAWESADTGEDCTPETARFPDGTEIPVHTGRLEQHISADVAWAVQRYWQVTGDDAFMAGMGAEIILETARFWASRAARGADGRYHIANVIGPDEYHERVDDNVFTNGMARQNLHWGRQAGEWMARAHPRAWEALAQRTGLDEAELATWPEVARGLADGFDPVSGLYEQFAGYFALEDLTTDQVAPRPFAGELALGADRLHGSQIIKQADVLMLAHLLPEVVPPEVLAANYRYYEPRTSHGSSLSPAIHAALAARVGDLDAARAYFRLAAGMDLDNRMASTAEGLHLAAMGGVWQAAAFGFGGVSVEDEGLRVAPSVPEAWGRLGFSVFFRGARILIDARPDLVLIRLDAACTLAAGGPCTRLEPGSYRSRRGADGWAPLEPVLGEERVSRPM